MADTGDAGLDVVLGALKKHGPSRVLAYDGSDAPKVLVVPQRRRNRYDGIIGTLSSVSWTRLELVDAKGGILVTVDNDGAKSDDDAAPAPAGPGEGNVERMLALMLRAQREALSFRDAEVKALLSAQTACLNGVVNAVLQLGKLMQLQVDAAVSLGSGRQEAPASESESDAMVARVLPMVLSRLMAPPAPAPAPAGPT